MFMIYLHVLKNSSNIIMIWGNEMERKNFKISRVKLFVFAPIGALFGIIVFYITNYTSAGMFPGWSAATGLLAGLLLVSFLVCTQFFSFYKRSRKLMEELEDQYSRDKRNEAYDRSYLDPFLKAEMDASDKEGKPLSIIMADLDHFKGINDTYGHIIGDHILAIFAQVVLKCLRPADIITRYAGDELIVILPDTDTATAASIAERMRAEVANTYIPPVDNVVVSSINCSVGVATYPVLCDIGTSPIRSSEIALYMAKRSGRDCVRVFQHEMAIG